MLKQLTLNERIEKIYASQAETHMMDKKGMLALAERFRIQCLDKDGKVNINKFISFLQYLYNEAHRNGMLHALQIIQDPYERDVEDGKHISTKNIT